MATTDILCSKIRGDINAKNNSFNGLISTGKSAVPSVSTALMNLSGLNTLPNLSSISSGVNGSINSKVNDFRSFAGIVNKGGATSTDAFNKLAKCVGSDAAAKYLGIRVGRVPSFPNVNGLKTSVIRDLMSQVGGFIGAIAGSIGEVLGVGLNALEQLVPTPMVDALLKLIQCYEIHCGPSPINMLSVESRMNSIGLNLDSKIDYKNSTFNTIPLQKKHIDYATGLQQINLDSASMITKGITDVEFKYTPEVEKIHRSFTGLLLVKK